MRVLLEARNVRVVYRGGVVANDDVNLDVMRGEILALLGENGAGKTTLARVIAGIVKPERGEMVLDGSSYKPKSYVDALRKGVYLIPQTPQLFENLTVLEDIILTLKLANRRFNKHSLQAEITTILESLGVSLDLKVHIWKLSMGERQKLEILKALLLNSKLIIMDEPTTHMTPQEFQVLEGVMRGVKSNGGSIIFITHKIWEALRVSDRIAVMRRGRIVSVMDKNEASEELLVKLMFGDNGIRLAQIDTSIPIVSYVDKPVLEVRDLWVKDSYGRLAVRGVSFNVRRGEILGVAGIAGNGQRELFEALVGLRRPIRGSIIIEGEDVTLRDSSYRVRKGLAIIPEERVGWGLVPGLSIVENTVFSLLPMNANVFGGIIVDWGKARRIAEEVVSMIDVKIHGLNMKVEELSGGNMQKLMVARELYKRPRLIIAMNPTGGLDARTARAVRRMLLEHASSSAILIISEDLDELLEVSTRILVINRGFISGSFNRPFNVEDITKAMIS